MFRASRTGAPGGGGRVCPARSSRAGDPPSASGGTQRAARAGPGGPYPASAASPYPAGCRTDRLPARRGSSGQQSARTRTWMLLARDFIHKQPLRHATGYAASLTQMSSPVNEPLTWPLLHWGGAAFSRETGTHPSSILGTYADREAL